MTLHDQLKINVFLIHTMYTSTTVCVHHYKMPIFIFFLNRTGHTKQKKPGANAVYTPMSSSEDPIIGLHAYTLGTPGSPF